MYKLKDINESELDRVKVDKNGTVLCIQCEKNPANISEYGMLRKCSECEKIRWSPFVSLDEPYGRHSY